MRWVALLLAGGIVAGCGEESTQPADVPFVPDPIVLPTIDAVVVEFWIESQWGRTVEFCDNLPARFVRANGSLVDINVVARHALPVPTHDVSAIEAAYPDLSAADAARIWYYENAIVAEILVDIATGLADAGIDIPADTLTIVLSDAQFEASAYFIAEQAEGLEPLVILESQSMGGWSLGPDYTSARLTEVELADETIHEVGHFMGLDHACSDCFELPYADMLTCCDACPFADDVMSYCRTRPDDTATETNVFMACTQAWIEDEFLRAYETGYEWPFQPLACGVTE